MLALYWAVRVAQGGNWPIYLVLGASIGAAMATRITLATLGLTAMAAAGIAAWRAVQGIGHRIRNTETGQPAAQRWEQEAASQPTGSAGASIWPRVFDRFISHEFVLLCLAGAITLLSFRALAPDAFTGSLADSPVMIGERPLDNDLLQGWGFFDVRPDPRFIQNLTTVRSLVTGEYDFPPSQQWVGREAYIFPWRNMLWGMGPALALAAWIGWAIWGIGGVRRFFDRKTPLARKSLHPAWVLFIWVGFYFGWQGAQFAITMRYLLPIYGALIIFAAWALLRLWDAGRQAAADTQPASGKRWNVDYGLLTTTSRSAGGFRRTALKVLRFTLPIVLLLSAGWAYAFSRIYTQPNARVMAAQWLADHAPAGSYVMAEIWDDPLPLQTTDASWGGTFEGISSPPYGEDDPRKWLGATNGDGRYEEGMLDQLDRADYITLTSNRIYDSTSRLRMRYPATMRYYHYLFSGELGFELAAEITSYPQILGIEIPDQAAEEAFTVYDHQRVLIFQKTPEYSRVRAEQLITADVNWGEVYKSPVQIADRNATALRLTDSQWPRYAAAGDWMANRASSGFFAALAPLTWLLVLELLGLAMFALLFRFFPRLPDRGFSLAKVLGLLLVAYAAWLLGSLGNSSGLPGSAGAAPQWPIVPLPFSPATLWLCAAPLLLVGAFAAYGSRDELRTFWHARRRAILSAEAIFLGFFLLGLLLRWFNPDLWHPARGGEKPMDFAFLNAVLRAPAFPPADPWHAGGYINYYYFGFVLVGALIQLTAVAPSIGYNLAVATVMALTALAAWGVIFNLLARRDAGEPDQPSERRALVAAGLTPALMLLLGNMAQPLFYLSGYAADQGNRPEWAFWDATRIVNGTVNEFPFFTFLFADLHAHMIVMPLSLALLGLAVAVTRGTHIPHEQHDITALWRIIPVLGLMGLLAGAIRATNTWDYPTFVGLAAIVVLLVAYRQLRAGGWDVLRAALLALTPLSFILFGNLLFAPFTANFATESSGVELLRDGGALSTLGQVLAADRTSIADLLRLHGHWLLFSIAGGLLLLRRLAGNTAMSAAGVLIAVITLGGIVFGWPAPILLIPLLSLGIALLWALRRLPLPLLARPGSLWRRSGCC